MSSWTDHLPCRGHPNRAYGEDGFSYLVFRFGESPMPLHSENCEARDFVWKAGRGWQ